MVLAKTTQLVYGRPGLRPRQLHYPPSASAAFRPRESVHSSAGPFTKPSVLGSGWPHNRRKYEKELSHGEGADREIRHIFSCRWNKGGFARFPKEFRKQLPACPRTPSQSGSTGFSGQIATDRDENALLFLWRRETGNKQERVVCI